MEERFLVGIWLQLKHKKPNKVINSWSDKPFSYDLLTFGSMDFNDAVDKSIEMFWDTNHELLNNKKELMKKIIVKDWICVVESNGGIEKYNDELQAMKKIWNKNK